MLTKHITIPNDFDVFTELTRLALDLYTIVQELFEVSAIEDAVRCWARVVDHEFVLDSRGFSTSGFGLTKEQNKRKSAGHEPTEKVTQQSSAGTDHLENEGWKLEVLRFVSAAATKKIRFAVYM